MILVDSISFLTYFFLILFLQIKREILVEEFEQMTIGKALSEGQTRLDLFHSGLATALEPKVLKG